ncbi:hypothetical protein GCM10011348_07230 [Marinobacterium nitratireducens]|uniref:Uncharacterized protein n=1 Tax=Marinobacterium nitratireducens TaxID=518897 RepID=A0A917ZAF7_9GAMM|nr:EAL domain-containing protein [Marinobacterium nitratireducens]GGO77514.1 hypothetical protein GCM10011348_07230 [Marinobacterium nitratireducens]
MPSLRLLKPGIATCLAYLGTGALGLMIAIEPGFATLLWLPAGIALGMAMHYGRAVLWGVFLGSCLLNIGVAWHHTPGLLEALPVALMIALGATLQAQTGAWLVRRYIGHPLALHQPAQVMRFILVAGPLSCLINGTIGPLALLVAGQAPVSQLPLTMLTWWIGDSLGVTMALPLMLVMIRPLRENWMPPVRRIGRSLLLVVLASLLAFQVLDSSERRHQLQRHRQYAEVQQRALQDSLDGAVSAASALRGFVDTIPEITPDNFRRFTGQLLDNHRVLQGISWNPLVRESEAAAFEARMQALYGGDFQITPAGAQTAGDRVVVGFIEPQAGNREALGFDVFSNPERQAALRAAGRSGEAVPTDAIHLVQADGTQAGVLLFMPVYSAETPQDASRWSQLRGFATVVLRIGDLVRHSLGPSLSANGDILLLDPDAPPANQVLFASETGMTAGQLQQLEADGDMAVMVRSEIRFGAGHWELLQYARAAYLETPWMLYGLLSGGLLLSGLYCWLLMVLAGQRSRVQQQVIEQTRQLAQSNAMLAEAQRVAGLSQWIWRPATGCHVWSDALRQQLGLQSGSETSVQAFLARLQPACRDRVAAAIEDWLGGANSAQALVCELQPLAGKSRYLELQSAWVGDEQGQPEYLSIVVRDITERWLAEEQIRRLAYYDSLTGLPNRELFHENLRQQILQGRRGSRFGALMFIDLDNFKSLNDTLGHSVGDELLRDVTLRLRQGLREQDIISRFGGDEFVILLPCTCADEDAARSMGAAVAQKVIDLLQPPFQFGSYSHSVSASVGVTLVPQGTAKPEVLIMQADTAMYRAKNMGKGRYAHYEPDMQAELLQQVQLEQELRKAVSQGQLELHYQPQFDRERRLVGAEALVRWRHPQQGLLLPGSFVGVAEESGLIGPLGEWVLDQGVRQLGRWSREGYELARLSVNVCPSQLDDAGFIDRLDARLAAAGVLPQRLCLELTEQVLLPQASLVQQRVEALQERGYCISIDDFGTGYSSLNYLKKLSFHELKIARDFVRDLPLGRRDSLLVKTILSMARTLGVEAIAEGVETVEQYEYLCQLGCQRFQGFYLGRPVPGADFQRLLATDYAVDAEAVYEID